jgi:hypothetical protein
VDDELSVALGAWKTRVYDPDHPCAPGRGPQAEHLDDSFLHRAVANDTLRHLRATCLELRLYEHEGLPTRRGELEGRLDDLRRRDERRVADDEIGRERKLGEMPSVRPLPHDDARILP